VVEEKVEKPEKPAAAPAPAGAESAAKEQPAKKKLSYKLQRELEALPGLIEEQEAKIAALNAEVTDPAFYQRPASETAAALQRLQELQEELDAMLERWAELEG